jgi:hypothetical protein
VVTVVEAVTVVAAVTVEIVVTVVTVVTVADDRGNSKLGQWWKWLLQ